MSTCPSVRRLASWRARRPAQAELRNIPEHILALWQVAALDPVNQVLKGALADRAVDLTVTGLAMPRVRVPCQFAGVRRSGITRMKVLDIPQCQTFKPKRDITPGEVFDNAVKAPATIRVEPGSPMAASHFVYTRWSKSGLGVSRSGKSEKYCPAAVYA